MEGTGSGYVYVLRLSSYFAQVLTRRGVYSRAAFISHSASNCAAFIRGRRLFEGGVYSRAASIRGNTVYTVSGQSHTLDIAIHEHRI